MPADEYLCDGGDHLEPVHFGGDGGLRGIDPRDAVIEFRKPTFDQLQPDLEKLKERYKKGEISAETYAIEGRRLARAAEGDHRPRVLPTNVVCLYAPRFAAVRTIVGPNEAHTVDVLRGHEIVQRQETNVSRAEPRKLVQNQTAELNRGRARASSLQNRTYAGSHIEVRVLGSMEAKTHLAGHVLTQGPQLARNREKPMLARTREKLVALKSAESAVMTGVFEGASQTVMAWKPQEMAGVEEPPSQPGLAVVKQLSATEAEPGDVITVTIHYRNMGNTTIASVSVLDSLLPRLEYLPGSASGPKGTVFTAADNRAGSTELRWDLPGTIAPGAEGSVTFQAKVR
jgi:uncharacterized repeat protein (TIGR01451 family)